MKNKLLNPCNPCLRPGAQCEQCMFGYRSAEDNHKHMKELMEKVLNGEKPYGWKCATTYMAYHHDWKEQMNYESEANELPYTRSDKELNDKIAELMDDYEKLVTKAKRFGLDIRLYDDSETLVLYYNDDYPDTLLVDKDLSSNRRLNKEEQR